MLKTLNTLNIAHGSYGIVACGPMFTFRPGCTMGVVLRSLDAGNTPAADPSNAAKYVVHTMYDNEGVISFEHGHYFDVGPAGERSRDAIFTRALSVFAYRMFFKAELADPLLSAAQELLESARVRLEDPLLVGRAKYNALQETVIRLTGVPCGLERAARDDEEIPI